ncbi:MAG: benzylsuccinate synthase gamma subunit family protein [Bacillota bacterium]
MTCEKCKWFFPFEDDQTRGDCVNRVVDQRQGYWKAKPKDAGEDASKCPNFQVKGS